MGSLTFFNKLAINPKLTFTNKGYKYKDYNFNTEGLISINYIGLSLPFSYQLKNFNLLAGPEINYLVNTKNLTTNIRLSSYWNKIDLIGLVGFGYKINEKLCLELTYHNSIIPIFKSTYFDVNGNETGEHYKEYNQSFQLSIKYRLINLNK